MILPGTRTALRQIENLSRVQQPLEFLHEFGALIAARFRIDEDDDGPAAGHRDRFDDKRPAARRSVIGLLVHRIGARVGLLAAPRRTFFRARRFTQTRFEALASRQFDNPRRRHHNILIGTCHTTSSSSKKKKIGSLSLFIEYNSNERNGTHKSLAIQLERSVTFTWKQARANTTAIFQSDKKEKK